MEIVMLVLKIIGLVLLGILGLAVTVLLLILFVPFRYRGTFRYLESAEGEAEASWLLKLVRLNVRIDGKTIAPELRIFYFFKKKLTLSEEKREPEEKEETPEEHPEKPSLKERFETLKKNFRILKGASEDDRITGAIAFLLDRAKGLLKHIMPKKLSGYLNFGLKSPFDTARVLSLLAVTLPLHRNQVDVTPDFEKECFETDMSFRGRIILSVIGALAIRTVLNKDVRYLVRTYRKYFGKKKEENKENAPIPAGAEQKAV